MILIDCQTELALTVSSIDGQILLKNTVSLAKAAKSFNIPTILTTIRARSFGGPIFPQLEKIFPDRKPIDCNTMSVWEDRNVVAEVRKTCSKKLVMSGVWTDFCVALSTVHALKDGYEVYVVTDACGDLSVRAHEMAIERMIQAGAVTITLSKVLLELQCNRVRKDTSFVLPSGDGEEFNKCYGPGYLGDHFFHP